jgi:ubiquinol-cytochrome c reductase cytochrome c1 subunit
VAWDKFPKERLTDMAALQNGAKLFVNYCLNCHGAEFMRYNRLRDIGLTEEQIKNNLMFTGAKVGDHDEGLARPKDAKDWFGGLPPDLTVMARSRSAGGRAAVRTTCTPTCAPSTATTARPPAGTTWPSPASACRTCCGNCRASSARCSPRKQGPARRRARRAGVQGLRAVTAGTMTPREYNEAVADLVAFLQWMAEPTRASACAWASGCCCSWPCSP